MDQDPASYFQNGLEMTVLFLNYVIVFQSNVNLVLLREPTQPFWQALWQRQYFYANTTLQTILQKLGYNKQLDYDHVIEIESKLII